MPALGVVPVLVVPPSSERRSRTVPPMHSASSTTTPTARPTHSPARDFFGAGA
ncbi:hypothetical protein ACFQX7_13055 [Luedemannella flava]